MKLFVVAVLCPWLAETATFRGGLARIHNSTGQSAQRGSRQSPGFVDWYNGYNTGLGIWKWQQALEAYQIHFGRFNGGPVNMLEIGVQSGGSIGMYKAVLGAQCHYYGMDINSRCKNFADDKTTIAILDQGNTQDWAHFFSSVVNTLDIIIDDGGHKAFQMHTTLTQAFPHVNAGGVILIEDIHAQNEDYITGLFNPAADFLAAQASTVASVHIYPFVLVVQKSGGSYKAPAPPSGAVYDSFATLMAALPNHRGQVVTLRNAAWATQLSADSLKIFFQTFYEIHLGSVSSTPDGCFSDAVTYKECSMIVTNTNLQSLVTAVDIYATHAQIHVASSPPLIFAARKGTKWIPYSG